MKKYCSILNTSSIHTLSPLLHLHHQYRNLSFEQEIQRQYLVTRKKKFYDIYEKNINTEEYY